MDTAGQAEKGSHPVLYGGLIVIAIGGGVAFFNNQETCTDEFIPYQTKTIYDDSQLVGYKREVGGKQGIKKVCKRGNSISSETVSQEPVHKVIVYGSKNQPTNVLPTTDSVPTNMPSDRRGYLCEDGTVVYGSPSEVGRANDCYGHGGFQVNH